MGERDMKDARRELFTPRVGGVQFRCEARHGDRQRLCGCNVFWKPDAVARPLVYECNACGAWYEGELAALDTAAASVAPTEGAENE